MYRVSIIPEKINFFFKEITEDDLIFNAELWLNSGNFDEFKAFMSEGIMTLNEAFKEHGITVPDDEYTIDLNENTEAVLRKEK